MDFIVDHAADIWTVISSVIAVAAAVAKLTPTPKDDEAIGVIQKTIKTLALHPK